MDSNTTDKQKTGLTVRPWRVVVVLAAVVLGGCAATIAPPPLPTDPAPVYVLDHGRHNSLVLVTTDQTVMRFVYGEWRWYVEGETGPLRSLGALFRDTQAALGRARLDGPLEPDCWVDQVGSKIHAALVFAAESGSVDELVAAINQRFEQAADQPYYSHSLNLEFIPDPRPYRLGHNSNHQVVAWLEELGFSVRGSPALGRLRPDDAQRSLSVDSSACSASAQSDSS